MASDPIRASPVLSDTTFRRETREGEQASRRKDYVVRYESPHMAGADRRRGFADGLVVALLPAALLVITVTLLMSTSWSDLLGRYAIFGAFVGGAALTVGSVGLHLFSERSGRTPFVIGYSLCLAAVLLYVVYGCVFGCPG